MLLANPNDLMSRRAIRGFYAAISTVCVTLAATAFVAVVWAFPGIFPGFAGSAPAATIVLGAFSASMVTIFVVIRAYLSTSVETNEVVRIDKLTRRQHKAIIRLAGTHVSRKARLGNLYRFKVARNVAAGAAVATVTAEWKAPVG
jgi:hypothetical protein